MAHGLCAAFGTRRRSQCHDPEHRIIITERMRLERPSDKHFTDHENGDSLDNRRENDHGLQQLRWLTTRKTWPTGVASARPGRGGVPVGAVGYSVLKDSDDNLSIAAPRVEKQSERTLRRLRRPNARENCK